MFPRRGSDMGSHRPNTGTSAASFADHSGPEGAVMQHLTGVNRFPAPPVPRLQLPADQEARRMRLTTPVGTGRPGASTPQKGMRGALEAAAAADASRPRTAAHPLFPTNKVDPNTRLHLPGYLSNTQWFNDAFAAKNAVLGHEITPNAAVPEQVRSARKKTTFKKAALDAIEDAIGGPIPLNLLAIANAFVDRLTPPAPAPPQRDRDQQQNPSSTPGSKPLATASPKPPAGFMSGATEDEMGSAHLIFELDEEAFTRALGDLDVPDAIVTPRRAARFNLLYVREEHKTLSRRLFELFAPGDPRRADVPTILSVFNETINGTHATKARTLCFNKLASNGFVHATTLEHYREIMGRGQDFRALGATSDMVRVLGDVLLAARKEEEDDYINNVLLKKKKGKKKKAPPLKPNQKSHIPPNMARISHIDLKMFSRFFDTNRELAAAFAPVWLPFILSEAKLVHKAHEGSRRGDDDHQS